MPIHLLPCIKPYCHYTLQWVRHFDMGWLWLATCKEQVIPKFVSFGGDWNQERYQIVLDCRICSLQCPVEENNLLQKASLESSQIFMDSLWIWQTPFASATHAELCRQQKWEYEGYPSKLAFCSHLSFLNESKRRIWWISAFTEDLKICIHIRMWELILNPTVSLHE